PCWPELRQNARASGHRGWLRGTAGRAMAAESADGGAAAREAVEAALAALSRGQCAVVADPGRLDGPAGCSLALAAACATTERLAFMIRHSTGLIPEKKICTHTCKSGLYP
ncbi:unnamed protein product, partial [Prorocentrum cordatum]